MPLLLRSFCIWVLSVAFCSGAYDVTVAQFRAHSAAVDASGELLVCGYSWPGSLGKNAIRIGTPTDYDNVALIKFAANGTVVWAAVLGGDHWDSGYSMVCDVDGNVIIVGDTISTNFPGLHPPISSRDRVTFVIKLDATGTNIAFTKRLSAKMHELSSGALSTDKQGNIYVVGVGAGVGVTPVEPSNPGPWNEDAILITKLSANGDEVFTRRFGGERIHPSGIAVDDQQNIYITGDTFSAAFPTEKAVQPWLGSIYGGDAFVAKISANGNELLYSTFVGGERDDHGRAIAVNAAGEAFVTGTTTSKIFPKIDHDSLTSHSSVPRAFLVKLSADGSRMLLTNLFEFNCRVAVNAIALRGTELDSVIVAGTAGEPARPGIPFLVHVDADGGRRVLPIDARRDEVRNIVAMAVGSKDRIYTAGQAQTPKTVGYDCVVSSIAFGATPLRWAQMVSPAADTTVGQGEPILLAAASEGFNEDISEVRYFTGGKLIGVATNAPFSITWTNAARGRHAVRAVVSGSGSKVRTRAVRIQVISLENDEPSGARPLRGERASVRGSTSGATASLPFAPHDVWYVWRAPRDGVFQFRTAETNNSHEVAVLPYTGRGTWFKNIQARAGERYYIAVGSYDRYCKFTLLVEPLDRASNDDFATRMALSGAPIVTNGSLAAATLEQHDIYDPHFITGTLWYSWIAPTGGVFLVSVQRAEARLLISRGAAPTNLVTPNDQWSHSLVAKAGEEFSIAVVGTTFGAISPEFTLSILPLTSPANDDFAERMAVTGTRVLTTNVSLGATIEEFEPAIGSGDHTGSIWWTWTAPSKGAYFVRASGPTFAVFAGDSLQELSLIQESDWSREIVLMAEKDETYQIAFADQGSAAVTLWIEPAQAPANDHFANASVVDGSRVTIIGTTSHSTLEPNEPNASAVGQSVWYRWTAPASGEFTIKAVSGTVDIDVYSGDHLEALEEIGPDWRNEFRAIAGVDYHFAVVTSDSGSSFNLQLRPVQRPPNDSYANRIVLNGVDTAFASDTRDATTESGEPGLGDSVWWSWTAPASGVVAIVGGNEAFLAIYTGDELDTLNRVVSSENRVSFTAQAGVSYSIKASSDLYGNRHLTQWHLFSPVAPTNDYFRNASAITNVEFSITTDNTGATREAGEPLTMGDTAGKSLWWKWRPRQDAYLKLSTYGSTYRTVMGVYRENGTTISHLKTLAWADSGARDGRAELSIAVRAGYGYLIVVDGRASFSDSEFGTLHLEAVKVPAPDNDEFVSRLPITTEYVEGATIGASREKGEPDGRIMPDVSVWWSWIAPTNGAFVADLNEDFYFEVFRGSAVTNLHKLHVETDADLAPSWKKRHVFKAVAGSNYVFRISSQAFATGSYRLALHYLAAPPNDYFTNRTVLSGTEFGIIGSNTLASFEFREPGHCVWYEWRACDTRPYLLTATGSVKKAVHVFTGSALTNLTRVKTPGYVNGDNGSLLFRTVAGTTYFIAVGDSFSFPSPLVLDKRFVLSMRPANPPPNDDFANRITLSGSVVSVRGSIVDATTEPGEIIVGFITDQSAWWSWTAPAAGAVTIHASGTQYYGGAVFVGDAVSNLTVVATNRSYDLPLTFEAVAGQTYAIAIDGISDYATGDFTLTISGSAAEEVLAPARKREGNTRLRFAQPIPFGAVVETSSNLLNWVPFHTNISSNVPVELRMGLDSMRFFRVR